MAEELRTVHVEVCVVLDCEGDYAVGTDYDAALEAYKDNVGADPIAPMRRIGIRLLVPVPTEIKVVGSVPPDGPADTVVLKAVVD